ncbi:MAG: hypothetical protein RLY31_2640 [Bacteroidota bacterium]|jgi:glycosyltransferase involved in cell wall biosynthesis
MATKALVISNYRDTNGVRPEAELFIRLQQAGVRVTIMTFPDAPYVNRFRSAGIVVIPFHPTKKFDLGAILTIRKTLVHGQYDFLHLFNSRAIRNGLLAATGIPVKVILYRGYTGNIHWLDPSAYLKYLHPRVDRIICIAPAISELFRRQPGFRPEKAVTISKGHDPAWYDDIRPNRTLIRNTWHVPDNAFLVVCVANNRRMKGIPVLLEATCALPPTCPVHFLLIGNNMDDRACRKWMELSPLRNQIHLAGFRTDVLSLLAAADGFVLPSLFGEATTKALLEAMSLGVPPIITDIPGNKAVVSDGLNGRVVPPGNPAALAAAIHAMANNRVLARQWGAAARDSVRRNFHIQQTTAAYLSLYADMQGV